MQSDLEEPNLFPELLEDAEQYKKGSAVRALEVNPPFGHYLFIERNVDRASELSQLKAKFPDKAARIEVINESANTALKSWLDKTNWVKNRAVVFLDPFGMSVDWEMLKRIADTRAIDLWYLCPIFAINRMLVKNQLPPEAWQRRLTEQFGTEEWKAKFYSENSNPALLEELASTTNFVKTATYRTVRDFLISRLNSIFKAVSEPLVLSNSKGSPLFLFIFAAGNDKGANAGLRIAKHLIGG